MIYETLLPSWQQQEYLEQQATLLAYKIEQVVQIVETLYGEV
jgi:hypothetical protein